MFDEVFINGEAAEQAKKQLQQSTSLTISRDSKTGKISATGKAKTKSDKQLLAAINDKSITVNVTASNSTKTSTGANFTGGAFMGNEVTSNTVTSIIGSKPFKTMECTFNTVTTQQEVNPTILGQMDSYFGSPGASILHEVTESYEGGLISNSSGVSSPHAGLTGSVYEQAHEAATPQPGEVYKRDVDGRREIYIKEDGRPEIILNTYKLK